jgi:hypothetical protein
MVSLGMIMLNETGNTSLKRALTEEDHTIDVSSNKALRPMPRPFTARSRRW